MKVGLGVTCARSMPAPALAGLAVSAAGFRDGAQRLAVGDVTGRDCHRLVGLLEQEGVPLQSFNFSIAGPIERVWHLSDASIVGAVLLGDDLVQLDPANVFDPVFPPPCHGLVPPQEPIRLLKVPRGHLAAAGDERVFSTRLCEYFLSISGGDRGLVIYRGELLANWRRFFPGQTMQVLAQESIRRFRCRACGTSASQYCGVWLGLHTPELTVCRDNLGIGHGDAAHAYVVSVKIAREMEQMYRGGYGLAPVIDMDGPAGSVIRALLPRLERLASL